MQRIEIGAVDGRGFAFHIPPAEAIEHPAIRAAAEAYERAQAAAHVARRELTAQEQARPAADTADREAYADALSAGKRDPGTKHADAADRRIADARRYAEALELVERRALDALAEAVDAGQEAWNASTVAKRDTAREQMAATLDTLTAKLGELNRLDALVRFTEGRTPSFQAGGTPTPAELRGNERVTIEMALAVLRRAAAAPEQPRTLHYREGGGELRAVQSGTGSLRAADDPPESVAS
jgi:hypothetical protein